MHWDRKQSATPWSTDLFWSWNSDQINLFFDHKIGFPLGVSSRLGKIFSMFLRIIVKLSVSGEQFSYQVCVEQTYEQLLLATAPGLIAKMITALRRVAILHPTKLFYRHVLKVSNMLSSASPERDNHPFFIESVKTTQDIQRRSLRYFYMPTCPRHLPSNITPGTLPRRRYKIWT